MRGVAGLDDAGERAAHLGDRAAANYNSPGQVVISGHNAAVDRGIELAQQAKAKRAVKLPVSIAAHSELMRVVADEFRAAITRTELNLPEIPILANITAEPLDSLEAIRGEMEGQLTTSVRWTESWCCGWSSMALCWFIEMVERCSDRLD